MTEEQKAKKKARDKIYRDKHKKATYWQNQKNSTLSFIRTKTDLVELDIFQKAIDERRAELEQLDKYDNVSLILAKEIMAKKQVTLINIQENEELRKEIGKKIFNSIKDGLLCKGKDRFRSEKGVVTCIEEDILKNFKELNLKDDEYYDYFINGTKQTIQDNKFVDEEDSGT